MHTKMQRGATNRPPDGIQIKLIVYLSYIGGIRPVVGCNVNMIEATGRPAV